MMKDIPNSKQGFKGKFCQCYRLKYFTIDILTGLDLMHLVFEGIRKRLFKELTSNFFPYRIIGKEPLSTETLGSVFEKQVN